MHRLWSQRWHSVTIDPREGLDGLLTDCGLPMLDPIVLEARPYGDILCDVCADMRAMTGE